MGRRDRWKTLSQKPEKAAATKLFPVTTYFGGKAKGRKCPKMASPLLGSQKKKTKSRVAPDIRSTVTEFALGPLQALFTQYVLHCAQYGSYLTYS